MPDILELEARVTTTWSNTKRWICSILIALAMLLPLLALDWMHKKAIEHQKELPKVVHS